jgi:hypothetical protein
MATPNKLYYPKSHIVNNLFTKGKEWMFEDGTELIGYYHKYIDGNVKSGAVFSNTESKKLIPYIDLVNQPDNYIYNSIKTPINTVSPIIKYTFPTVDDFEVGKISRYFIKRRNYSTFQDIFEIDKNQYKLWKINPGGINSALYNAIELDWKLTGPLRDVVAEGNISESGVYDTNLRIVMLKDNIFTGLKNYLTDYIELSIYSAYISQDIKKQFGNVK